MWADPLMRLTRLALFGLVGMTIAILSLSIVGGAIYVWLTTGLTPLAQVREGGVTVLVMWPLVGLAFAPIHVFGAFVEGGVSARVGMLGITGLLVALWVLALRRGRAFAHTVIQRWL